MLNFNIDISDFIAILSLIVSGIISYWLTCKQHKSDEKIAILNEKNSNRNRIKSILYDNFLIKDIPVSLNKIMEKQFDTQAYLELQKTIYDFRQKLIYVYFYDENTYMEIRSELLKLDETAQEFKKDIENASIPKLFNILKKIYSLLEYN